MKEVLLLSYPFLLPVMKSFRSLFSFFCFPSIFYLY
ncbi:unnamed protein product [Tenebrio molitor]|nr:unnamed protein product [Tenebrio molitor]